MRFSFAPLLLPFGEQGSKPSETGRPGVALQRRRKRYVVVFINNDRFPKLDVAGSTPVSRSILSMTYSIRSALKSNLNGVHISNELLLKDLYSRLSAHNAGRQSSTRSF